MKKSKKKAFTLTELLVIVIVIGVLAAVTLPTFNKVLETRKTTEAEDVLAALRTEQEYRCAMEKPYATDLSKLDTLASNTKKNFDYKISTEGSPKRGTGTVAVSKGKYNYSLKMPSYADGRICCDGTDCSKLNKDYPTCSSLLARADFKKVPTNCSPEVDDSISSCEGPDCGPDPTKCGPKPENLVGYKKCPEGTCGRQVKEPICDKSTGYEWKEGSTWDDSACETHVTKATEYCDGAENKCGRIEYDFKCDKKAGEEDWEWVDFPTTECVTKPEEALSEDCPDGKTTRTGTYVCRDHAWDVDWEPANCPEEEETITCAQAHDKLKIWGRGCRDYGSNLDYYSGNKVSKDITEEGFWRECCGCQAGHRVDYPGEMYSKCSLGKFEATEATFVAFNGNIYHPASAVWCVHCSKKFHGLIDYVSGTAISDTCSTQQEAQQFCDLACDDDTNSCNAACVYPYEYNERKTLYSGKVVGYSLSTSVKVKEAYFDGACTYTYGNCAECPSSAMQDYLLNGALPEDFPYPDSGAGCGGDPDCEAAWDDLNSGYYDSYYSQECSDTALTYEDAMNAHPDCMINFGGCANFHAAQYETISCSCHPSYGGTEENGVCKVPAVHLPQIGWTCGQYNTRTPCSQYAGSGYESANVVVN